MDEKIFRVRDNSGRRRFGGCSMHSLERMLHGKASGGCGEDAGRMSVGTARTDTPKRKETQRAPRPPQGGRRAPLEKGGETPICLLVRGAWIRMGQHAGVCHGIGNAPLLLSRLHKVFCMHPGF